MHSLNDEQTAIRVGLLGEIEVELQLVLNGWHPVRLDTAQMASNADLLAVNKRKRVSIQVKTTDAGKQHSHSKWLGFGYSTNYIKDKKSVFNSKESPLIADVVIGVSYRTDAPRFVVMPVAFAEALCRLHCDYWYNVPTKTEKGTRSTSFPIYLAFTAERLAHKAHHDRIRRNILAFENKWSVLSEPIDKLHSAKAWRVSK
jgi:hypothetical protein